MTFPDLPLITDVNDYRLELARKMGADAAVNVQREDLPAVMQKQGLVEGFDIGLEMSGNGAGLQQMISVMRNGGKISLLGISNKPVPMDMNTIICKGRSPAAPRRRGFSRPTPGPVRRARPPGPAPRSSPGGRSPGRWTTGTR